MWFVYMSSKNMELHKKYITGVILKHGTLRKKEATDKLLILIFPNQRRKSLFHSKLNNQSKFELN